MSTAPLPSNVAVDDAWWIAHDASPEGASRAMVREVLVAAYAIDVPRIRAEERAATIREVVEWLRSLTDGWGEGDLGVLVVRQAADAIEARFQPGGR